MIEKIISWTNDALYTYILIILLVLGGLFFCLTADLGVWYSKCTLLAVEMTGL